LQQCGASLTGKKLNVVLQAFNKVYFKKDNLNFLILTI